MKDFPEPAVHSPREGLVQALGRGTEEARLQVLGTQYSCLDSREGSKQQAHANRKEVSFCCTLAMGSGGRDLWACARRTPFVLVLCHTTRHQTMAFLLDAVTALV